METAVTLDEDAITLYHLDVYLEQQGDYERSIEIHGKALYCDPMVPSLYHIANLYGKLHNNEKGKGGSQQSYTTPQRQHRRRTFERSFLGSLRACIPAGIGSQCRYSAPDVLRVDMGRMQIHLGCLFFFHHEVP